MYMFKNSGPVCLVFLKADFVIDRGDIIWRWGAKSFVIKRNDGGYWVADNDEFYLVKTKEEIPAHCHSAMNRIYAVTMARQR